MKVITYTDGGSRGNPGPAASGVYIQTDSGKELARFGTFLGFQTNNFAEYTAIKEALFWIDKHKKTLSHIESIECRMDSQLACRQLLGEYKVRHPHIKVLFDEIVRLQSKIGLPFRFVHVPREQNTLADAEVNRALDNMQ